jgi:hypothetical protein
MAISFLVTPREWLEVRGAEFLAAIVTAGLLLVGVWLGVPLLRARIGEVLLYSFCCVSATVLHTLWDLAVRCGTWLVYALRPELPSRPVPGAVGTRAG